MAQNSILKNSIYGISILPAILVCLLCYGVYLYFFAFKAQVVFDIEVLSEKQSVFKIYWAAEGDEFTERNSNEVNIFPGRMGYSMLIGNMGNIDRLRIDPLTYLGKVNIHRLNITQMGYAPILLETEKDFQQLQKLKQINPSINKNNTLELHTTGRDGQLLFDLKQVPNFEFPSIHIYNFFIICLLYWAVSTVARTQRDKLWFVPCLLFGALSLAAIMASITTFSIHPDERVHYGAVKYYSEHLLPPSIEDPEIADTFSEFGKSRLSSYEIYYPLAGSFTRLLSTLHLSYLTNARLFSVFLLAVLLLLSIHYKDFRCFTLPLLITPQAWYLFSYINSDAFGLFLVIVTSYQAAVKTSLLNRYLSESVPSNFWLSVFGLGALCGSLILLKPNYYFFIVFLGMYLIWRIFNGDFPEQKRLFSRLGLLFLVAITLPGIRYGLDIQANGLATAEKQQQMIEKKASYLYRPSTPMAKKHIYLYLKDRDITLDHVLNYKKWGSKILLTSFGSYGYTEYNPSRTNYEIVRFLCVTLFLTILISVLINSPPGIQILFFITTLSAGLLLSASLFSSWTLMFQAQGRYLAPILAMGGICYYHIRPYLFHRVFNLLVFALFSMSLYSFIFIGLRSLEKTSFAYG